MASYIHFNDLDAGEVEVWDVQYLQNGPDGITWISLATFWNREDAVTRRNMCGFGMHDTKIEMIVMHESDAEQICE